MKHIYYFFIFIPILLEFYYLVRPLKAQELYSKFKKDSNQQYDDKDCFLVLIELFNIIWITLGFLTFQWYAYAGYLIFTGLFYIFHKKFNYSWWSIMITSLFTIGILIFIFYNAYVLQFKLHL